MRNLLLLLVLLSGCTTFSHKAPDGSVTRYSRWGPQDLTDVSVVLPDGAGLEFSKQEADVAALVDSITEFIKSLPIK